MRPASSSSPTNTELISISRMPMMALASLSIIISTALSKSTQVAKGAEGSSSMMASYCSFVFASSQSIAWRMTSKLEAASVASSAGRVKGTSAPYLRPSCSISGSSVERIRREQYFERSAEIALKPNNEMPAISLRFFRGTPFDWPRAVIRKRVFIVVGRQLRGRSADVAKRSRQGYIDVPVFFTQRQGNRYISRSARNMCTYHHFQCGKTIFTAATDWTRADQFGDSGRQHRDHVKPFGLKR